MFRWVRLARALLLSLVTLSGCTCRTTTDANGNKVTKVSWFKDPPALERFADAPATIHELRSRAKGTIAADVRQVTITWPPDDGSPPNCGHAGVACVLIYLLPRTKGGSSTHQVGTLRDGERMLFEGTFSAAGELQGGEVFDGERVRIVSPLDAPAVKRRLLVVVAEATVSADGGVSEQKPVSVLDQVDLVPGYLDALVEAQKSSALRASLVVGEVRRLISPDDMKRFVTAMKKDTRLTEATKTAAD